MNAERARLAEARQPGNRWRWWGPHLPSRQWGTVREDYSPDGSAWSSFPHDHARSRAYRWGEDGLAGICDRWQHICVALALWNGRDPILKERLFGLTNDEGNHGEDVKEYWWPLDSTPTHSWMTLLYKYPQAEFPYGRLVDENRRRSRDEPEFELIDTGVFDGDRYFDVTVTYAKASPDDILMQIDSANRGPDAAPLHVLPLVWFRNTWSWGRDDRRPHLRADGDRAVLLEHKAHPRFWLAADGDARLLFCENESNTERLWGVRGSTPYPKDGINDHVISGASTVGPDRTGTKAAAWYRLDVPAGETATVRLRLSTAAGAAFGDEFDEVLAARRREADEFYADLSPPRVPDEQRRVQRRAVAGLLWGKKHYRYDVGEWLEGDPTSAPPAHERLHGRNSQWAHLYNADVISMPDEWEYPWYAAWDLAFHMIPLANVDPDFAKDQLILFCREWFMHPNGQLPAYEWAFGDVNPPVHAWAAWRVYKIDAAHSGTKDYEFLERIFHKLLINFSWWVNRKDAQGSNLFEGGFLGLDNVGVFDRSAPLPSGARLEQSDATSWMAMFCLNMLAIAMELAERDPVYEDTATKFFEHFLAIAHAMNNLGHDRNLGLWDEEDGFFYDLLSVNGEQVPMRIRSIVGLIPLFAVETMEQSVLDRLPDFADRMRWFTKNRPGLCDNIFELDVAGMEKRRLLAILDPDRLRRVLRYMLDESEFLSPYGIRSLSRFHADHPVRLDLDGQEHEISYQPGESTTGLFGGNSNWRGPVWFPINYLLIESLQKFHHYFGDGFTVEFPTGSGRELNLWDVAAELSRRLIALFVPDEAAGGGGGGGRPVNAGHPVHDSDPWWREQVAFHEYFHGDTGAGLGARHQTGWTALVAKLIRQSGR
ncbi:MAG: MGH1-like glycoside hydrolase domain-containing protein [Acidimicrobiales bacterium]